MRIKFDFENLTNIENGSVEEFCMSHKDEIQESLRSFVVESTDGPAIGDEVSIRCSNYGDITNYPSRGFEFEVGMSPKISFQIVSIDNDEIVMSLQS